MRRIIAGVAALLTATPLLTACTSGSSTDPATTRPKTEITLPTDAEAWNATSSYPPSTVTLAVGQRLGARGTVSARQWAWDLTSAGDGAVLRRGPDVDIDPCPEDMAGCASGVDQTFIAIAPGTTTLTWEFRNRGTCDPGAGAHPAFGCGNVSKSIQVTVR
ncbi:hypothetical protein KV557_24395 [Kitasatospora aureofaciens]|uniref:hypothetical protein n=1 Tax=Kitasatospora aureofaciens TaxID=1894 RepID=UPI001C459662|nr:hypothetical protein [Kitasatospora aureofaciens]MBV6700206.1 hypothetical protein [Kitasatospora aureofaciens]